MKKIYCCTAQIVLLLWFFLDMTGLYFGEKCLVTSSYKEDGIFFLIYLAAVILFLFVKEKIGRWLSVGWMSIWLFIQFICHEWYTIFNSGFMGSLDGKIKYFSDTIQWIQIDGKYVPDVYHTVLHMLILIALTLTIIYTTKNRKMQ